MAGSFRALGLILGQPPAPLADSLDLAERAEQAGFSIFGVGDLMADSFTLIGALAERTEQAELFTSVAGWTRSPVATALAASTSSELSDGRFRLGLGPMPQFWSEAWHGVDYARPLERMREFVGAVRTAMSSSIASPTSFEGERYAFTDYNRPVSAPGERVPVYLGATRPGMTRLAGEIADGLIANSLHTVPWLRDVQLPALQEGLQRASRRRSEIDVGVLVMCSIDEDTERAAELARQAISFYFVAPYFEDMLRHHGLEHGFQEGAEAALAGDRDAASRAVTDEVVDLIAVHGTPEDVRSQLERYEGVVDWLMLSPPVGQPAAVVSEQLERIVEAARPLVA